MSLIEPLLRFFDIIEFRERQAERRDAQEAQPDQPDPELVPFVPPRAAPSERRRRCRVCGQEAETPYCLTCLADTMEALP